VSRPGNPAGRIQWNTLRNELIFASVFGMFAGYLIGFLTSTLNHGVLAEDA
jgi:hypothetical protein